MSYLDIKYVFSQAQLWWNGPAKYLGPETILTYLTTMLELPVKHVDPNQTWLK